MKNNSIIYFLMFALVAMLGQSCQKYDKWDEPAGNQKIPPPEVNPAYSQCAHPTMGKEDNLYYIYSNNAPIDGIVYQKGLLLRTTPNLVTMNIEETSAYVLSNVIEEWAGERLQELDGSVEIENIVMGEPCLKQINEMWYLFYSVSAGTNASIIAYATATSLSEADWEDQGELLASDASAVYKAISPSVCIGADNGIYMAFGGSAGGIYISKLDLLEKTAEEPVLVASRAGDFIVESPELFYAEGQFNLIFTMWNASFSLVCQASSSEVMGNYTDFTGRSVLEIANFWELTRSLTSYQFVGGTMWETVNGLSTYSDNGKLFALHHAIAASSTDPNLHIRTISWLKDDRMTGRIGSVPVLSPTRYYANNSSTLLTTDDIVGDWHYGTLWGHINSGINDPMSFSAGGVYDGGAWDFDEATQILHLISSEWGNEDIYIKMSMGNDWDHDEKHPVFIGSGVNNSFGDHPGVWMKKQSYVGIEEGEDSEYSPQEHGIFAPTIGVYNNRMYMYGSAPESINKIIGQGFPLLISTGGLNASDFNYEKTVLANVADWAVERIAELNGSEIDSANIRMQQPNLRQVSSNEWRLYYSVSDVSTNSSVIAYATANNPEGPWTDKGEILYSNANSVFCANAPCFVSSTDGDYLAFGGGHNTGVFPEPLLEQSGVYGVAVNADGTISETPKALYQRATDQLVGQPLFMQHGGYWHIIAMQNSFQMGVQGFSDSPLGTYYEFGGRNVSDAEFDVPWNHANVLQGYLIEGGETYTNLTGGVDVFQLNESKYAVHQITVNGGAVPTVHIRRLDFFDTRQFHASTQVTPFVNAPYPNISLAICTSAEAPAYPTSTDVSAKQWNYQTGWPLYAADVFANLSDAGAPTVFTFKSDGGLDILYADGAAEQGVGVWDYSEESGVLHFQNPKWGNEHIYFKVYKQNGELVASGVNASFGDKPLVMMKQKAETLK